MRACSNYIAQYRGDYIALLAYGIVFRGVNRWKILTVLSLCKLLSKSGKLFYESKRIHGAPSNLY